MRSSRFLTVGAPVVCALLLLAAAHAYSDKASPLGEGIPPDPQIPSKQLMSPEELNGTLKSLKPVVLQVGPRSMYQQAHIPGAEYVGATSAPEELDALRTRVKSIAKDKLIVIYCGCCPWERCPNIRPAYKQLRDLGYSNVHVLYIADNFGKNWVDKGYPVEKGE